MANSNISNIIIFGQSYLGQILYLSILLIIANSFVFYNSKKLYEKIFTAISFGFSIASILLIMNTYKKYFELILQENPPSLKFQENLMDLNCVFILQILSLILLCVGPLFRKFKKGSKTNGPLQA